MRWLPTRGGRWPTHLDRRTRQELGIPARERILGWGTAVSGTGQRYPVAATNRALYAAPIGRIRWDEIGKATWEEPILRLTATMGGVQGTVELHLVQPGLLPAAVRTQVTDSVVITERLDLGQGMAAQAVARRDSQDGQIRWTITFDPGADPEDADLRARADRALTDLRANLGI